MNVPTATDERATLVTTLLDRSHSMLDCKDATIEGFNGYVATLQDEVAAKIDFTFLQFDSVSLDKVCVAIPVRDVAMLTESTYLPRGSTPLIEAAIKTIRAVETSLSARADNPRVVITFQTDGKENCSSPEFTWNELRRLIAEKQEKGWQFNFLGAGIDAYDEGRKMGIGAGSTMSYGKDRTSVNNAFAASASNVRSYATGVSANTDYTLDQKLSAGDRFIPEGAPDPAAKPHRTTTKPTARASDDLDLTKGNATRQHDGTVNDLDLTT